MPNAFTFLIYSQRSKLATKLTAARNKQIPSFPTFEASRESWAARSFSFASQPQSNHYSNLRLPLYLSYETSRIVELNNNKLECDLSELAQWR